MRANSTLTPGQRHEAIALFEQGRADSAVATSLGVSRWPVRSLYRRWRIHGPGALVTKHTKKSYSFEFKVEAFTAQLEEYIAWFNHERVHSYLEGLSPVQYRAQALAA